MNTNSSSGSIDTLSIASSSSSASSSFIDGFNKGRYRRVAEFVKEFTKFIEDNGEWMKPDDIERFQRRIDAYKSAVNRYQSLSVAGQLAEFFSHKNEMRTSILNMKRLLKQFEDYRTEHFVNIHGRPGEPVPSLQAQYIRARNTKQAYQTLKERANIALGAFTTADVNPKVSSTAEFAHPAEFQSGSLHDGSSDMEWEATPSISSTEDQCTSSGATDSGSSIASSQRISTQGWDTKTSTSTSTFE